jgi:hypothetical protein
MITTFSHKIHNSLRSTRCAIASENRMSMWASSLISFIRISTQRLEVGAKKYRFYTEQKSDTTQSSLRVPYFLLIDNILSTKIWSLLPTEIRSCREWNETVWLSVHFSNPWEQHEGAQSSHLIVLSTKFHYPACALAWDKIQYNKEHTS